MAADTDVRDGFGQVSRVKDEIFEYVNVVASWIGIVALVVLLAYVLYDALELQTASGTWYAVFALAFFLPQLAAGWYYYRNRTDGRVALVSLAIVLGGISAGFATLIVFVVLEPSVWFTYVLTFVLPTAAVTAVGYGLGLPDRPRIRFLVPPVAVVGVLLGGVATGGFDGASAVHWAAEVLVVLAPIAALVYGGARRPEVGRVAVFSLGAVGLAVLVGFGLLGLDTIFGLGFPGETVVYGGTVVAALVGLLAYFLTIEKLSPTALAGVVVPFVLVASVVVGRVVGDALAPVFGGPMDSLGAGIGGVTPGIWTVYFLTLVVPGALAAGWFARERELVAPTRSGWLVVAAGVVGAALVGTAAVPILRSTVGTWLFETMNGDIFLVFLLTLVVPSTLYAASVLDRDGGGERGLLGPVVLAGGYLLAEGLVELLGATEPESWLDWQFVTSLPSSTPQDAGLYVAIIGSVFLIVLVALLSFPLGVGAALYLEEYASSTGRVGTLTRIIQVNISNLAGVPSVVYGLLGLGLFVNLVGLGFGTVLVGAMTLSLLILPIVIISSQEAIRAVPDDMRQASYGMGATRWQTVRNVVLPRSMPGILTGTILALGRAIGETAPLIMIGMPNSIFNAPAGPLSKSSAMPLQIFNWAFRPEADFRHGVVAAGVVVLLFVLLTMNSIAILVRNRYERRT